MSRSPVKPNRSSIARRGDLAVGGPGDPPDRLDGRQHPRLGVERRRACWVRCWSATVRPCLTRPADGAQLAGEQREHRGLAGAVDADDADPVAGAEPPGRVRRAACRSPRTRSTSSMSMTSLPSRWVANRCSSSRSRGGGTSSISALAASMRNFGFEVRAGGAAAQPGELLADQVLPAYLRGRGLALPLGLGQHERGVAALVGVDDAVVDLPGPLADRVEEPPVVGDHDQRGRPRGQVLRPARRPPRRRGGWWARRARAGRGRRAAARPASSGGARRRTARAPRGRGRRRRAAPRRPRGCAGRRPTRGRRGRRAPPRARCGCRRARRPGGGSRSSSPRCCETRPASGSSSPVITSSSVVLPSPLRPTMPIRSPAPTPSETSVSSGRTP